MTRGQQWYVFDPKRVNRDKCVEEAMAKSKAEKDSLQTVHDHSAATECKGQKHTSFLNGEQTSQSDTCLVPSSTSAS